MSHRAGIESSVPLLVKGFPACCGTGRYTTVSYLAVIWATQIQSTMSHIIYVKLILILSFHSHVRLSSVLFPQNSSQNSVCTSTLPRTCYTLCPSHSPLLDCPSNISMSSTNNEAPHFTLFSNLLLLPLS